MEVQHVSVGEMLKQSIAEAQAAKSGQNDHVPAETPAETPAEAVETAETEAAAASEPEPEPKNTAKSVKTEAKSPPDVDKRLEKLSAASQRLISERQKFAEERKQYEKELAEARQWREIVQNAKEDPVSLAELAGIEPDKYATLLLEKGSLTPERRRVLENEKKVRSLEERLQQKEVAEREREAVQTKQQVLRQIATQLRRDEEVSAKFELVNELGRYEDVLKIIEEEYHRSVEIDPDDPKFLSFDEAAEIIESRLDKELERLVKLNKIRSKVGSLPSGAESPAKASNSAASRKSPGTITSKVRAQSSAPKQMTEAERLQAAGEYLLAQMQGRRGQ